MEEEDVTGKPSHYYAIIAKLPFHPSGVFEFSDNFGKGVSITAYGGYPRLFLQAQFV